MWHSFRTSMKSTETSLGIKPNGSEGHPRLQGMKGGVSDMRWIAIAASLILVALFLCLRLRNVAKKIEKDIFF